ncbi:FAD:protein FMN transferase [Chryseobacterium aquaeductus]|uniref:FAD:protein FMN transferase n=1 Tax=Chryseobacterium aquaeductus TaxID=2675056 RepID=A0A9N8MKW4_9FLAO|nr:FAD:protein FMN transferase [Chryseobacterium aquaeductus]CAA7329528.1 FAD:protein FMN transferase [Chryseobacterium potabilaquae]CAD7797427.1 FAD:protein FMN transferase [Chryseobacterium aquaeductus]
MRTFGRCLLGAILFSSIYIQAQIQRVRRLNLMGSRFEITVVDKDSVKAEHAIDRAIAEITRIEDLISEWQPETQISLVNQNAGIQPVKVDHEVIELTKTAIKFSQLTDGAFDISIVAMDKIWKFDGSMDEMPSQSSILESVKNVDYRNIEIDSTNSTIYLKKKGMKIGFGSIGKGYAADRARLLLKNSGVLGGIINASGDLSTWGTQPNGRTWAIGVNNPFKRGKVAAIIKNKSEISVTTSGSYEKYAEIDGKRFSHIINPKNGMPSTGLTSVTVIGPDATSANGFSTSIMVLGEESGVELMKKFPQYQYLLITDKGKIIKKMK